MKFSWKIEEYNQNDGSYLTIGEFPSKDWAVKAAKEKLEEIWQRNPYKEERDELFLVAPDGSKERIRGPIVLGPLKIGQIHTRGEAWVWFILSLFIIVVGLLIIDSATVRIIDFIKFKEGIVETARNWLIVMGACFISFGLVIVLITKNDL